MIKFKLGIINTIEYTYDRVDGETLDETISRVLKLHFKDRYIEDLDQYFVGVVNGLEVEQELSPSVEISEKDSVVIVPSIKGGNFGQVFKQLVIIAAVIAVSIATSGIATPGLGPALVAATAIGTTLIMNSLIPPPGLGDNFGLGAVPDNFTSSQTYVIGRQSNVTKRFGRVPKVYGTHRMFPIVAANAYTTLESVNGEIVQFFYAIYDFGYGPNIISDVRIGNTPILGTVDASGSPEPTFLNTQYRLVDLNKPTVSEGTWDDLVSDSFTLYKGDVETDELTYTLNKDENASIPAGEYQVVRELSANVQGSAQEIIVDFVFPKGLIGYDAGGAAQTRTVGVKVEFAKVGTNDWRSPSDVLYVDDFSSLRTNPLDSGNVDQGSSSLTYGNDGSAIQALYFFDPYVNPFYVPPIYDQSLLYATSGPILGHTSDQTFILAGAGIPVGASVFHNNTGHYCGDVVSIETVVLPNYSPPVFGYTVHTATLYHLDKPIGRDIVTWNSTARLGSGLVAIDGVSLEWGIVATGYRLLPITSGYSWTKSNSNIYVFSASTNRAYYSSLSFKPKDIGQYKVRITRLYSHGGSSIVQDELTVLKLSSRFDRDPIVTDKRHTFLEVKIQATNQLNGALQNLSGVVASVLDVYDENTLTWNKEVSNNPAWIFADLLTSEINKKAIDKSRLDVNSLVDWAEYCNETPTPPPGDTYSYPRFRSNFVLDYDTTLQSILNQVANSCQASLNVVDGKYGVLVDRLRTTPVQIFTPRNSWGFSSVRSYIEQPDVLRIAYISPIGDWRTSNTDVFSDGKDINNYETVEEMVAFGTTNVEQAWRFGRYMQAQSLLRKELITLNVDFEYLVCNRGDYVQITQDVMRVGGTPARVRTVIGSQITIDTEVAIDGGESYGYVFRDVNGVTSPATLTVDDQSTFTLDGTIPAVGDLVIIGIVGQEVFDCLVKTITPSNDLSAELTLVEKADGVYDAESTSSHPTYESYLTEAGDNFAAPGKVVNLLLTENDWRINSGNYEYYMTTVWDIPTTGATDVYEVYVDTGNGVFTLDSVIKETTYEYIVNHDNLGLQHCFKVLAVSANGDKISLVDADQVCDTPIAKITPPTDIAGLFINITDQTLTLEWTPIADEDIQEYLIRYSPITGSTWESSIPLLQLDKNTTSTTVQARTGRYFIKALDLNNNQSDNAASAFTSIPELFNLNVVDATNDFPDLLGSKDRVTLLDASSIILEETVSGIPSVVEYNTEGYYYYKDLLDLGEIHTVRLQSQIQAEGYSPGDLMANWVTLDSVLSLASTGYADWDVETQVRYTDSYNVIANWIPMGDVALMSEGDTDIWGPWVKFVMGDFTGRIFQFRLKLISYQLNSTPRVFDGVIRSDMPDRLYSVENTISSAVIDTEIVYAPAFFGPGTTPNIEITQDNMQQGDYYQFVSKSLSKMVINFYDKNDVRVSRQFDMVAKGYGRQYTTSIY